jgi:hypothetical protein
MNHIKNTPLFKRITEELVEDCFRYTDGELDELEVWADSALDNPEGELDALLLQIPQDEYDDWWNLIDEKVEDIVTNLTKQLS